MTSLDGVIWLGASDLDEKGYWRWRSDNALMSIQSMMIESSVKWDMSSGEPSDTSGTQNCLIWWSSYNNLWDYECSQESEYMCEVKIYPGVYM